MFGWDDAISIGGSVLGFMGGQDTNAANAGINSAQMAFNETEAQKNRDWQEKQRGSNYQAAVGDLKAAGLNPMLAYMNGAAKAGSGAQATAGSMLPMSNATQAGATNALTAAQIKNVNAQTAVAEVTAQKLAAEIPLTTANTGQVVQKTENMKQELFNLKEDMTRIIADKELKQQLTSVGIDTGNLQRAQTRVAEIEIALKAQTISKQEAETQLTQALTQLRGYEMQGAKNLQDFEKMMETGGGNASKATGAVANVLRAIKSLTGK